MDTWAGKAERGVCRQVKGRCSVCVKLRGDCSQCCTSTARPVAAARVVVSLRETFRSRSEWSTQAGSLRCASETLVNGLARPMADNRTGASRRDQATCQMESRSWGNLTRRAGSIRPSAIGQIVGCTGCLVLHSAEPRFSSEMMPQLRLSILTLILFCSWRQEIAAPREQGGH